jgi:hypothetical protein
MKRTMLSATLALAAVAALALAGAAGGKPPKGSPKLSATPVFKLLLKPSQEVPPVRNLRADAVGSVTFDLERSGTTITSGEVIFYLNYAFPAGPVNVTGLHVHQAAKGVAGPIVVDSGVGAFVDGDGTGNITSVVTGVAPATLQAILDNPRGYYVNLHTSTHPMGALRDQLHNPKKR